MPKSFWANVVETRCTLRRGSSITSFPNHHYYKRTPKSTCHKFPRSRAMSIFGNSSLSLLNKVKSQNDGQSKAVITRWPASTNADLRCSFHIDRKSQPHLFVRRHIVPFMDHCQGSVETADRSSDWTTDYRNKHVAKCWHRYWSESVRITGWHTLQWRRVPTWYRVCVSVSPICTCTVNIVAQT